MTFCRGWRMLAVLAVLAAAKGGQALTGQVVDFLEQVEVRSAAADPKAI